MKHIVYFFSGTGNSLSVVKKIEQTGATVKSIPVALEENKVCDAEKVGFVFPVYYLGMPKCVHEFMESIKFINAKYIYMVCTMGWNLRGGVIKQMKSYLKNKNLKLNMGYYIQMPMNDFTYASVHDEKSQKKILSKVDKKIDKALDLINNEKQYFSCEPVKMLVEKQNGQFCSECNENDKKFTISSDCVSCGICAKVCPVGNIELKDGKPVWKHSCQMCFGCFHLCPKKAISYDGKGTEITHYRNPDCSVAEIEKYHHL